jgi:hypothetical protein
VTDTDTAGLVARLREAGNQDDEAKWIGCSTALLRDAADALERLTALLHATDKALAESQRSAALAREVSADPGCPWCAIKAAALADAQRERDEARQDYDDWRGRYNEAIARLATLEGQVCERCVYSFTPSSGEMESYCQLLDRPVRDLGNRCGRWAALDTGGQP